MSRSDDPFRERKTLTPTPKTGEGVRVAYLLSLPALLLFAGVVVVPLVMTVVLTFHDWGQYKGIEPVFILKNWKEVFTDSYFLEMFGRTFRIAFFVTLFAALL